MSCSLCGLVSSSNGAHVIHFVHAAHLEPGKILGARKSIRIDLTLAACPGVRFSSLSLLSSRILACFALEAKSSDGCAANLRGEFMDMFFSWCTRQFGPKSWVSSDSNNISCELCVISDCAG